MSIVDKIKVFLIGISIVSEFITAANLQLGPRPKRILSTVKFVSLLVLLVMFMYTGNYP